MRQAGRSLPEYRELRAGIPMLAACRRPDLVCEITLQPVRRHRVDAAILFSDIVVPVAAAGIDLEIDIAAGPARMADRSATGADLDRVRRWIPAPWTTGARLPSFVASLAASR
jgi:uroporphyrinogen decarboxylase